MNINKYIEARPWGKFEQFTHNQPSTVKIITVKPNEAFSLQYHNKREEWWRILAGSGKLIIGAKELATKAGDEHFIGKGAKHRATAGPAGLTFLEIAFGEFDENDIVRLEDKYGR